MPYAYRTIYNYHIYLLPFIYLMDGPYDKYVYHSRISWRFWCIRWLFINALKSGLWMFKAEFCLVWRNQGNWNILERIMGHLMGLMFSLPKESICLYIYRVILIFNSVHEVVGQWIIMFVFGLYLMLGCWG